MRVQRALARAGVASRRKAETLIRAGRVLVNGTPAELGQRVDSVRDVITVSGRRIQVPTEFVWLALHKPVGYVATARDQGGRPTVFALVPTIPGLTYVGRLDIMSSGLLLFTTDGDLGHRLLHPRYAVERSYRVRVHGRPAAEIRRALRRPIDIDGRPVKLGRSKVVAKANGRSALNLVLLEGRYRIVRRVCGKLGLTVEALTRLSHGPIKLGRLAEGEWRYLSEPELEALHALRAA